MKLRASKGIAGVERMRLSSRMKRLLVGRNLRMIIILVDGPASGLLTSAMVSAAPQPKTQSKTKRSSRQQQRRRASDSRMLRAAMSIIAQKGAGGAALAEIGVAAGFSRGLPAERFGTKLTLLHALMDFMESWFTERLHKAMHNKTGLDAVRA